MYIYIFGFCVYHIVRRSQPKPRNAIARIAAVLASIAVEVHDAVVEKRRVTSDEQIELNVVVCWQRQCAENSAFGD